MPIKKAKKSASNAPRKTAKKSTHKAVKKVTQKTAKKAPLRTSTQFYNRLKKVYSVRIRSLCEKKPKDQQYLDYDDAIEVTDSIRDFFEDEIGEIPNEIEAALSLSEAVLAPTVSEKTQLIKGVVGITGGTAGIGMIIGGIGTALGWGSGVVATVTALVAGSSLAGPIGWAVGGASIAGIAAYFALANNPKVNDERFKRCLDEGIEEAVSAMWREYQNRLIKK